MFQSLSQGAKCSHVVSARQAVEWRRGAVFPEPEWTLLWAPKLLFIIFDSFWSEHVSFPSRWRDDSSLCLTVWRFRAESEGDGWRFLLDINQCQPPAAARSTVGPVTRADAGVSYWDVTREQGRYEFLIWKKTFSDLWSCDESSCVGRAAIKLELDWSNIQVAQLSRASTETPSACKNDNHHHVLTLVFIVNKQRSVQRGVVIVVMLCKIHKNAAFNKTHTFSDFVLK